MTTPCSTHYKIPDSTEQHVGQSTQYGMRFPDGSIQWETIDCGAGRNITVQYLANGGPEATTYQRWWDDTLKSRALSAKIDAAEYAIKHRIVKRSIILTVTATEDV